MVIVSTIVLTSRPSCQAVTTYEICPTRVDTLLNPDDNAMIRHQTGKNGQSSQQCTLTLSGLRPDGYASLNGASRGTHVRTCTATILVDGDGYCVEETTYEPVIMLNANGKLAITVNSSAAEFSIELLTNCEFKHCDK